MDEERFVGFDLPSLEGIWRDEIENYEIALVNEMKITKYPYKWVMTLGGFGLYIFYIKINLIQFILIFYHLI